MTDLSEFRERFRLAFRNPRQVAPTIRTKRFGSVWVDLRPIGDWLAGPLYSINERGECDYVFADKDNRFPGVVTSHDFLQWCLDLAKSTEMAFSLMSQVTRLNKPTRVSFSKWLMKWLSCHISPIRLSGKGNHIAPRKDIFTLMRFRQ